MGNPIDHRAPKQEEAKANPARMSEWVVLDITAMTKSTTREKVLKVLKAGGITVCKVTDPYMNEARNKNAISITVKRADYETKSPDYPGSWIIEEDYTAQPEVSDPL